MGDGFEFDGDGSVARAVFRGIVGEWGSRACLGFDDSFGEAGAADEVLGHGFGACQGQGRIVCKTGGAAHRNVIGVAMNDHLPSIQVAWQLPCQGIQQLASFGR